MSWRRRKDEAHEWAQAQDGFFVPMDDEIQDAVSALLAEYPRLLDTRRGRSGADPFVIALAKVRGCAVVTGEHRSGSLKRPKIPDVCLAIGGESMSLLDLIRREGWVFR